MCIADMVMADINATDQIVDFATASADITVSKPADDRLIAGTPEQRAHNFFSESTGRFFAGTWESVSRLEGVPDSVVSRFSGPASETGWLLMLPERDPIPMRAWIQGDSLVAVSEPYPSILRQGVMVQVRTSGVLRDSLIHGLVLATYDSTTGQQVVRGSFTARRAPADTAAP